MTPKIIQIIDGEYKELLAFIKTDYRRSQVKAAAKVNAELLAFNWRLGRSISTLRAEARWGSGFFETLSSDLRQLLPESKGFSPINLRYMERFYGLFPGEDVPLIGEQVFSVPWNHVKFIIDKCGDDPKKALFYVQETVKNNWSRAVLLNFLETDLYERRGKAVTNFPATMPECQGDLAAQLTKDPYNFDFLALRGEYDEADLKKALLTNIEKFLLELGTGFAYLGREYRLKIGDEEEFCDMLFYNAKAHAYVVVEVKVGKLKPADIGQLGTYVVAVDHTLRGDGDGKTIGILICRNKSETVARYALESSAQPLGISTYEMEEFMPEDYRSSMPTIEELESRAGEVNALPEPETIGEKIKKRRIEIGLSQKELADLCGIQRSTIARIESGDVAPAFDTVEKIFGALGLSIAINKKM